jgi:hypothetical protein
MYKVWFYRVQYERGERWGRKVRKREVDSASDRTRAARTTAAMSADEAWAIRGLEGTGGEPRRGRVLSDEGRRGGDERERSRRDEIMRSTRAGRRKCAGQRRGQPRRGGLTVGSGGCSGLRSARFRGHTPCSPYRSEHRTRAQARQTTTPSAIIN